MRSFLFFVEGVHDINCVARILLINEFKEVIYTNEKSIQYLSNYINNL